MSGFNDVFLHILLGLLLVSGTTAWALHLEGGGKFLFLTLCFFSLIASLSFLTIVGILLRRLLGEE